MHVIDSHTGGEPTRVILSGGPDLGTGTLAQRAQILATKHKQFCQSVLFEPRGQPAMVAALLVEPTEADCTTGVIYFDADAVLGMCGHGTIGLAVSLAYLGRIDVGAHKIETPAGVVDILLSDKNTVTVTNVESRRVAANLSMEVEGIGHFTGDVAYGGNWFYIIDPSPIELIPSNIRKLTDLTIMIRDQTHKANIGGDNGELIDHIILQSQSTNKNIHSRNFVLCPDDSYDRSPCGTGSSARLACLAADGLLKPGQEITQESIIGSQYRLSYQLAANGNIIPQITGQAFVMAETKLIFNPTDPFANGIRL
ncbi:MAG: proline racemase family protein [Rhizobiales bacterium]|nr:proline racemase family protein [Hyphomicrobiales bacterium]NRB15511.1 proline racemase family protein [Hyphomicrobiales bacterium]